MLKYFCGVPLKIYLHEYLPHEYFHTRKFPDLRYDLLKACNATTSSYTLCTLFNKSNSIKYWKLCLIRSCRYLVKMLKCFVSFMEELLSHVYSYIMEQSFLWSVTRMIPSFCRPSRGSSRLYSASLLCISTLDPKSRVRLDTNNKSIAVIICA